MPIPKKKKRKKNCIFEEVEEYAYALCTHHKVEMLYSMCLKNGKKKININSNNK